MTWADGVVAKHVATRQNLPIGDRWEVFRLFSLGLLPARMADRRFRFLAKSEEMTRISVAPRRQRRRPTNVP